jgi:TolB protein
MGMFQVSSSTIAMSATTSRIRFLPVVASVAVTICMLLAGTVSADDAVVIDVNGARRGLYPIAIPVGVESDSAAATMVADVATFNMTIAGYFKALPRESFLADLMAEKLSIDPQKWRDVGAYGVMKFRVVTNGDSFDLEFRLYEVAKGASPSLSKSYRGRKADLRRSVHAWCNEVVKYYTGEPGFFGSKIAFTVRQRGGISAIYAIDFDGANPYAISRNKSVNTLPSWSRSGSFIAYTSYMRNNPDLYVSGAGGGRPKRLSAQRGMNTGASWSPDGSQIALTLSKDGNPEIYIISASDGSVIRRVTNDAAIDTSPTWSPDGSQLAFVSDRDGGPQIFVVPVTGGKATRVSFNGSYNTTPAWSPRKGVRVLAYTTRDGGRYDIVSLDLETKKMVRITQGEGDNEEPSFSPNGRAIAFARSGKGVFVANADGSGKAIAIWSGSATGVDWGPAATE